MAKDNVAISAAMSDKELLDSIDKTLKQAEQRFKTFAASAISSMNKIEQASFVAGTNIGKNMADGLNQNTNALLNNLQKVADKVSNVSAKTATGTAFSINVNELDAAIAKAGTLNQTFKESAAFTSQMRRDIRNFSKERTQAKAATEEARISVENAKQQKYLQRALQYRQQAYDIAQRTAKIEARQRITTAGSSYDSAMGMSARTIQERMDKMKALQIVQRNLASDNEKEAAQLKKVNQELRSLKNANDAATGSGVKLINNNSKLLESFENLGRRVLFYTGLGAITSFVKSLYQVRGEYEMLERSIGAVLGDFEKGSQIFREQQQLALKSPFTVVDLAGTTKQLAAYNFAAEELVDTSRRLADISAALGVPMERLTYNLGQIRAQTVLTARDARDFANAGLPITQELANMYRELEGRAVSVGEVMDRMSNRMVSFGDVMKVINRYTDEGGMFFEFQVKQAETLRGKLSNLTDAYNNMLNEMGSDSQGLLSWLVGASRTILDNWRGIARTIVDLIAAYGVFKTIQMVTLATQAKQLATTVKWSSYINVLREAWNRTGKAIEVAEKAQDLAAQKGQKLNKSLLSMAKHPYALIAAAIAGVGLAIYQSYLNATKLQRELNDIVNTGVRTADNLVASFDSLIRKLNNTTVGSREFNETLKKINSTYGEYLPNMLTEINYAKELAQNYDLVVKAINDKAKAQSLEKGMQAIEEQFGKEQNQLVSKLMEILNKKGISDEDSKSIISRFIAEREEGIKQDETAIETFTRVANKWLGSAEKMFKVYGSKDPAAMIEGYGARLYQSVKKQEDAVEKLRDISDARFSTVTYNSKAEGKEVDAIIEKYDKLEATQANNLAKLLELQSVYDKFGDSLNLKNVNKQIDDLTIKTEEWKKTVRDMVASAPKGIGASFDVMPDENSVKYIDRLKKSYQDLLKQREAVAGTKTDDATKQRIEDQISFVRQVAKELDINLETQKDINKAESQEVKTLKEQLSLVKDIIKSNEELVKKTGDLNLAAVQTRNAFQTLFDELLASRGIDFNKLITFNPKDILDVYAKLGEGLTSDKAKRALEKEKSEMMIEYSVRVNEATLKSAQRQINDLFKGYELELDIQEAGEFGSIFASLFDYEPVTLEELNTDVNNIIAQLEEQVSGYNKRIKELETVIELNVDEESVNNAKAQLNTLQQLESNTAKSILSMRKDLNDTTLKYYRQQFQEFQKLQNDYSTYEEQRDEVERKRLQKQQALITQTEQRQLDVAGLQLELSVATDPEVREKLEAKIAEYQKWLDDDATRLSVSIDTEASENTAKIDFEEWKSTSNAWKKSFEDLDRISTAALNDMIGEIKRFAKIAGGKLPLTELEALENKINSLEKDVQARNPIKRIADSIKNFKKGDNVAAIIGDISSEMNKLGELTGTIGTIAEGLGADPETVDTINAIAQSIQGVAQASEGVSKIMEGDIIGGITDVISGAWTAISGWFEKKNKRINREIEQSEQKVTRLENAYKGLDRAVQKAFGDAEIGARRAAIANQQLQLVELKRQLALEKSRKKKDQDKQRILELEGMITDLQYSIEDAMEEIVNSIMGTDAKSAAESFVSSMIDDFRNGEDWMLSFGESWDEMIDNMIMKAIVGRVIGDKMQEILDTIDKRIKNRTTKEQAAFEAAQKNADMTDDEIRKRYKRSGYTLNDKGVENIRKQYEAQLEKALKDLQRASALNPEDVDVFRDMGEEMKAYLQANFPDLMEQFGIKFGEAADKGLSGLQKGIQGITEETAGAIEAYMNNIAGQVFQQTTLQQQMVNLMEVNTGTNSQVLLALRESYQIMTSIRDWTISISNPAGNGIRVQLID